VCRIKQLDVQSHFEVYPAQPIHLVERFAENELLSLKPLLLCGLVGSLKDLPLLMQRGQWVEENS
jgi:hypothetical protein